MRENCGVRGVVHQKIGKRFGTGTGTHYVLSKGEEYQNLEHIVEIIGYSGSIMMYLAIGLGLIL